MTMELSDGLRSTIESGVRQRHPDYDEDMVRLAAILNSDRKRIISSSLS